MDTKLYWGPSQTSMMKLFSQIGNDGEPLTVSQKSSIADV